MFFITRGVGKVSARLGKSRLVTVSEAHSAAKGAGVQLGNPAPLHPDNVSEGGGDRDCGRTEQMWGLQDCSDQSSGGVFALQQI